VGEELPPTYPEIDPDKWYMPTVDVFATWKEDLSPATDGACDGVYIQELICCLTGATVINFISGGFDCVFSHELCFYGEDYVQRLLFLNGPWDNLEDCRAQLP